MVIGEAKETALVVTVPVPRIVITPVADHVVVADNVMLPFSWSVPVDDSVQVAPVVVKDAQAGIADNVTVGDPELLSTITASF